MCCAVSILSMTIVIFFMPDTFFAIHDLSTTEF